MELHIDFIDSIEDFKKYHPIDRVYETKTQDGDIYGETHLFEIMDWQVRMKCIGKKNGITKWKRVKKMSFEN